MRGAKFAADAFDVVTDATHAVVQADTDDDKNDGDDVPGLLRYVAALG